MFDAPVDLNKIPDFHFDKDKIIKGLKKLEFNSLIRKVNKEFLEKSESWQSEDKHIASVTKSSNSTHQTAISSLNSTNEDGAMKSDDIEMDFHSDAIIGWDIKSTMHNDKTIAQEILSGKKFWDLSQVFHILLFRSKNITSNSTN